MISICSDLKYKYKTEEILHEAMSFIENCGTGEAPKDVATKYCYIRFNTIMDGHFDKHVRLEFSGWEDENFVWDEEDDEAEEEEISN